VADLQALADAGASAFTDDGSTVFERETMRAAMEQAFSLDKVVMDHAEDRDVAHGGVMHQGPYAEQWNLPGIPDYTEARTVLRDAELAEETGCRMHIQHLSAHESLEYVRRARTRGVPVTAELTPHHAALIDANIDPDNANFKMNPPLRSKRDRESLLKGLADGNITALATDHAPHTAEEKAGGFLKAPFGIVGLETAVGVTYTTLVLGGVFDLETWLARWTTGPAAILGLPAPSLADGSPADLVLLDLEDVWTVDPSAFASKSSNTPFAGRELTGRAVCTILGGRITWREPGRQTA
jgi:dihydroorotase